MAVLMSRAQGQVLSRQTRTRRPVRMSRPATANRHSGSRFGSATRCFPVKDNAWVQASRSSASWTISNQRRLDALSW